jgi:4-amino-4-deoxy-L-arabinose transferase-like glycosyltransferase
MENRKSLLIMATIVMVAAFIAAQNMFEFPYYHDEEGTHVANSWEVATEGRLSPYTYSYEDPPAGSVLMGLWNIAVGDLNAFGFSVNSGRVLMLIMHVLTVALVYLTALKVGKSDLAATVAAVIFAFSPLVTALQRVVFLENMMIVWLLAAFYLVVGERRTLMHYFASAGFFALAVLTKGSAIYFLPALFLIILMASHRHHRRFAVTLWVSITLMLIVGYPLYAQMKEELFPENWWLGGDFPHVSLLERFQDRGPDTGRFLNYASGLGDTVKDWIDLSNPTADPVLIYGGLISLVFILILALDDRALRPLLIMLGAAGLELLFGGPVYKIDAILFLPLLAISVGVLVSKIVEMVNSGNNGNLMRYAFSSGVLVLLVYPFWSFNSNRLDIYTRNQVEGQIEAVKWASENLPTDAVVVTDSYAFMDLRATHPNTHDYWRIDTDPAVKFSLLEDNICNIDYVITTPQIYADTSAFKLDLMRRVLDNSEVLMTYSNDGWPVEIRQVRKTNCMTQVSEPAAPAPQLASAELNN